MSNTNKQNCGDFGSIEEIAKSNAAIIAKIDAASDGEIKEASAAGTQVIKREIRERCFVRNIIPPQSITNEDLDRNKENTLVRVEDMEPLSKGAVTLPFGASTDAQFYNVDRYEVTFETIWTPEWTQDINRLRTNRADARQIITDNSLRDVETREDAGFITLCDTIVGSTSGVGLSGVQQNFNISGGITSDTYPEVLGKLYANKLNNGCILMNRVTALEFLKWDRNDIGGDLREKLFKGGMSALEESVIFGVKHLFTSKQDLVPNGVVYAFAEPNFLGKFYTLQDVTMYVKKEKNIIRTSATEIIGLTIANVAGVVKCNF